MRILLIALLIAGCSSQYMPRTPGRIAITMQAGKPVYVRDGRTYEHGVFGGGLADAVAGNPAAEQAAGEYHSRMTSGFIGMILGVVAMTAGGTIALVGAADSSSAPKSDPTVPITVAAAGFVAMMVGAAYLGSAEPYRWDAINLFNDQGGGSPGFRPGMPPPPPPPLGRSSGRIPTLAMRPR
jgi:hypothetical protein